MIEKLFIAYGILLVLPLLYFVAVSIQERQAKAVKRASLLCGLVVIVFLLLIILEKTDFQLYILLSISLVAVLLLIPSRKAKAKRGAQSPAQFDERRTIFSRRELQIDTEKYKAYYSAHPEDKEPDDRWRNKPGLLGKGSLFYDAPNFAKADRLFSQVDKLKEKIDGKVSTAIQSISTKELSNTIKQKAETKGALNVGFCQLEKHHLYSVKGRGELYGKLISNSHKNAIAITVEMNYEAMQSAPKSPVVVESAKQYLHAGNVAVDIATYLRSIGYSAKAHIDGNYEVICPLVAESAGLGRIGRMGLLMTPELGPRVRIAVITTDAPLEIEPLEQDYSIDVFCAMCKKCVKYCPSQDIPKADMKCIEGVMRWKIDSETCFDYWCTCGTDCGKCMSVCPYSHPDNAAHNFIRWGIKNNVLFRRFALKMDNWFY
jgi:reductive dehalogenase